MALAFLLLNVKPGHEDEVLKELSSIPEVREARRVFGVYDAVVKVEAESMEKLKEVVNRRVKRLYNVTSITSLIVVSS